MLNRLTLSANRRQRLAAELKGLLSVQQQMRTETRSRYEAADQEEKPEQFSRLRFRTNMEHKIAELMTMLESASVTEDKRENSVVALGSVVVLRDLETEEELEYTLVESAFAVLLEDGISELSPLGQALMQKRVGDIIAITIPAGVVRYKIVAVD